MISTGDAAISPSPRTHCSALLLTAFLLMRTPSCTPTGVHRASSAAMASTRATPSSVSRSNMLGAARGAGSPLPARRCEAHRVSARAGRREAAAATLASASAAKRSASRKDGGASDAEESEGASETLDALRECPRAMGTPDVARVCDAPRAAVAWHCSEGTASSGAAAPASSAPSCRSQSTARGA